MILVWIFWLLLLAPGAALYLHVRDEAERRSGFQTIAVGYMLSFLVLVPFGTLAYALELPLWTFSTAVVLVIAAGLASLAQRLRAGRLRLELRSEYAAAAIFIVLLLLHASATGGHLGNDADFHLARIRLLFDHGFSNADPMTGTGFSHPYHTNIFHALVAAASKLTGLDPIAFWLSTLPWAKLLLCSAAATLCIQLGGSAFAAWLVCVLKIGALFWVDWSLYPNQLAPLWLLPLGLAGCIGLFIEERPRYHLLLIGACALLLGFVHGLYAGYFAIVASTALAVLTLHSVLTRKRTLRSALLLGTLGGLLLTLPAPALYVARATHVPAQANYDYQGGAPTPRRSKPGRWLEKLRADHEGRFHLSASEALGGPAQQALAAAALLALFYRKRTAAAIAIGTTLGGCLIVLHVPALAALAIKKLGSAWMLERLIDVVAVQYIALVGAGLVPFALSARRGLAHAMGAGLAIAGALAVMGATDDYSAEYFEKVGRSLRRIADTQVFSSELPSAVAVEHALMQKIPAGSVVLTHPLAARQLRKFHDVYFIRASRNHTGVDDMRDRTYDLAKLVTAKGPTAQVTKVLAKHGIVYAVQKKDRPIKWLDSLPAIAETKRLRLIELRPVDLDR